VSRQDRFHPALREEDDAFPARNAFPRQAPFEDSPPCGNGPYGPSSVTLTSAVQRFLRHAPTHDVCLLAHSCRDAFRHAIFRCHRLIRARSPATIADPPWLVRSPAPASLDQNAAYRNLQHDTTREHDSRLKFRSSPVPGSVLLRSLCVCRVFVCLATYETPESRASFQRTLLPAQQRVTKTLRSPRAG